MPDVSRTIDPATFDLTQRSADSVAAHVAALNRDRGFVRSNVESIDSRLVELQVELNNTDAELASAERSLRLVNAAVGSTPDSC